MARMDRGGATVSTRVSHALLLLTRDTSARCATRRLTRRQWETPGRILGPRV